MTERFQMTPSEQDKVIEKVDATVNEWIDKFSKTGLLDEWAEAEKYDKDLQELLVNGMYEDYRGYDKGGPFYGQSPWQYL